MHMVTYTVSHFPNRSIIISSHLCIIFQHNNDVHRPHPCRLRRLLLSLKDVWQACRTTAARDRVLIEMVARTSKCVITTCKMVH